MPTSIRRVLGIPVFYKVIIANAVSIACLLLLLFAAHVPAQAFTTWGALAVILAMGVGNALLVRAAMRPIIQHRELFGWMLENAEKERDRVAGALHDRLAQQLAAALLSKDLRAEVLAVIEELCETAQTLQPGGMRLLGLRGALEVYAQSLEKRTGVVLRSNVDASLQSLDETKARGLYRAIEDIIESLPLKPVDRVDVRLRGRDGAVEGVITIFHGQTDSSAYVLTSSEGFRIKERIAWLGGELTFMSHTGQTAVRVRIPINQSEEHVGYDSSLAS
jgi:signal transduction histidine kinase